jgi:hypothetical protein
MYIGVFSVYASSILALLPNTGKYFWRILHLDKALLAYLRNSHKELRIRWNKFALLIMPGELKGTVYQKIVFNSICWPRKTTCKFNFSVILKEKICSLLKWRIC